MVIDILKMIYNKSQDLDVCIDLVESCIICVGYFEWSFEWKWMYWMSIVIFVILMLNVFGLIVVNGRLFFCNLLYVLDLVVVFIVLGLEIMFDVDIVGLIIIFILWWIVWVVYGIFEVMDEVWEKNIY